MPEQTEGKVAEAGAAPSSPAAAQPKPAAKGKKADANPVEEVNLQRRSFTWAMVWGYLGINFLMFLRFFFPRALYEPNPNVNIGHPSDFQLGVNQQFLQSNRI